MKIGFQIGERIKSFKPSRLLYHDVVQNLNVDSNVYEYVDLDTLLAESDILICMCSLTKETEGIFNMKMFEKMKRSAIFINCSRGVVVNQTDLIQALKTKTIAAAGLDVTTPEPLPKDNELFKLKNCFITPHIGFKSIIRSTFDFGDKIFVVLFDSFKVNKKEKIFLNIFRF